MRHPPLPDVWQLNRVEVTTGRHAPLDADAVDALAERALAGLPHRRIAFDDARLADAVWPVLQRRGWSRERALVMVLGGRSGQTPPGRRPADDSWVTELDDAVLSDLQTRVFLDDADVTATRDGLAGRLADAQALLRAGSTWRAFGARAASRGEVVSSATLYLDADVAGTRVALVDQVATLWAYRERGLAAAVVRAAIDAARGWEADTIGLLADADDWPQLFYAGLGFAVVGRQTTLHIDVA